MSLLDQSENHRRFASLHFLGIPEATEGCDILGFTVDLIPQLLDIDKFPIPLSIESAHHTPIHKVHSNVRPSPRPILIKLVHFQDKWLWLGLGLGGGFPFWNSGVLGNPTILMNQCLFLEQRGFE